MYILLALIICGRWRDALICRSVLTTHFMHTANAFTFSEC